MKVRDMGRGRNGGAGAEADPLPQECRRGVKTTGIGSSLCLPALLGWACREMLLSPSRLGEERSAKGGALSCQAHGGCIHLAYATGQSVGSGILMIRAARRCKARAGKAQVCQKNEKSHPKVALSIL